MDKAGLTHPANKHRVVNGRAVASTNEKSSVSSGGGLTCTTKSKLEIVYIVYDTAREREREKGTKDYISAYILDSLYSILKLLSTF